MLRKSAALALLVAMVTWPTLANAQTYGNADMAYTYILAKGGKATACALAVQATMDQSAIRVFGNQKINDAEGFWYARAFQQVVVSTRANVLFVCLDGYAIITVAGPSSIDAVNALRIKFENNFKNLK